ncbi:Type IV secretory pathway, VirJ component [Epibacterium ulvae]|uniref:Type IV secretory pathway, VirJ component n=1 Tax=Epibacterium ulvae TaxID=1156985 RepID=A0A1G5Q227_9RHOB|nr:AcvB/VirJ family lysyl-phosphatidylglycerol hydrolase [Epibacterium ulvae]SCZ55712.1 Type IV secretory pathway, VirJ component [Epibacterium ulvae]
MKRVWKRSIQLGSILTALSLSAVATFAKWGDLTALNTSDAEQHVLSVSMPQGMDARSTAIFLVGHEGWTAEQAARAKRLSEMHTLVVGLDGLHLLKSAGNDCSAVAPLILKAALAVQVREGALARTPVLTAYGSATSLALSAADVAPNRFKGLVTVSTDHQDMLCAGAQPADGAKAPLRWLDVTEGDVISPAQNIQGATVVPPTPTAQRAFYKSYLRLAGTDSAFDTRTQAAAADLEDLPLTIHNTQQASSYDTYAIFLSGDGGWANFDKQISDRLAAEGIPVVGISSLRYMWREKSPAQIAADLTRIDAHYSMHFSKSRVLILGFSLGANTLPFAATHMPDNLRSRIAGLGLIAPETRTGFEIVVGGWLGQETGAHEVSPAIAALQGHLPGHRVMCLFGSKESVSACPPSQLPGMKKVEFEGGHHLGHAHDAIVSELKTLLSSPREG